MAAAFVTGCVQNARHVSPSSSAPVLDRIMQRGEIVVGTAGSMPPLNMTTRDGEVIGLEPDMAQAIANAMGVKLTLETMPFSELLPSLEGSTSQLFVETVLFNTTLVPVRNYDEEIIVLSLHAM